MVAVGVGEEDGVGLTSQQRQVGQRGVTQSVGAGACVDEDLGLTKGVEVARGTDLSRAA